MSNNRFGENLKEQRLAMNMSRKALAEQFNVSVRTISYWENGKRECSFDMLIFIATFFGTTVDYMLGRTDY